eukprot:5306063-Lingulodinium_polyedra.AAC.1
MVARMSRNMDVNMSLTALFPLAAYNASAPPQHRRRLRRKTGVRVPENTHRTRDPEKDRPKTAK